MDKFVKISDNTKTSLKWLAGISTVSIGAYFLWKFFSSKSRKHKPFPLQIPTRDLEEFKQRLAGMDLQLTNGHLSAETVSSLHIAAVDFFMPHFKASVTSTRTLRRKHLNDISKYIEVCKLYKESFKEVFNHSFEYTCSLVGVNHQSVRDDTAYHVGKDRIVQCHSLIYLIWPYFFDTLLQYEDPQLSKEQLEQLPVDFEEELKKAKNAIIIHKNSFQSSDINGLLLVLTMDHLYLKYGVEFEYIFSLTMTEFDSAPKIVSSLLTASDEINAA